MKKIDIVILHYGRIDTTEACVHSIESQCKSYRNIYVINNDNSINIYKHFKKGKKRVLINAKENMGFAKGVNFGIKLALKDNAEYVVLVNNDVLVSNDFIKSLYSAMQEDSNLGIASPVIQGTHQSTKYYYHGGDINKFTGDAENNDSPYILGEKNILVRTLSGCCMVIRSTVFKKAGYFDERYFMYYEDIDFCLRVAGAGFSLAIITNAIISHIGSAAIGPRSSKTLFYLIRSHMLFCRKHAEFPLRYVSLLYQVLIFIMRNPQYLPIIISAVKMNKS